MDTIMRRWLNFMVEGAACAATLDLPEGAAHPHGLLIVSGGNEIRTGAHRGMARLAAAVAAAGHPVWRFDRRGVGDSEGENGGFEASAADTTAAAKAFRAACPAMTRVTALGNCDAASALALHHRGSAIDGLLLANPWLIDAPGDAGQAIALPPAAAIRARYAARLRDPAQWLRLLSGGVDLGKLLRGLRSAQGAPTPGPLAMRLAGAMGGAAVPVTVLLAAKDGTAQAFAAAWRDAAFAEARNKARVATVDSASHGFADDVARAWLEAQVLAALRAS